MVKKIDLNTGMMVPFSPESTWALDTHWALVWLALLKQPNSGKQKKLEYIIHQIIWLQHVKIKKIIVKKIGGIYLFTFSSTQRKCTDKQNLLFSTLAPEMDLVFSTKILHTYWKSYTNSVPQTHFLYIHFCFFFP